MRLTELIKHLKDMQTLFGEAAVEIKEAEARLVHGWITVQGADNVVTKEEN